VERISYGYGSEGQNADITIFEPPAAIDYFAPVTGASAMGMTAAM
jgi:hypothetical protein